VHDDRSDLFPVNRLGGRGPAVSNNTGDLLDRNASIGETMTLLI